MSIEQQDAVETQNLQVDLQHSESELASDELPDSTEHVQSSDNEPAYSEYNPELDAFLDESTQSKSEAYQEEREKANEEQARKRYDVSDDDATQYAIMGIDVLTLKATEMTGRDCRLGENAKGLFAMALIPCIQKYGKHVKKYIEEGLDGLDDDSTMPEMIAGASLSGIGALVWFKSKRGDRVRIETKEVQGQTVKVVVPEGESSGDKP